MVGHDTTVEHRTFVALGDSFTEGLEDDLGPEGRHLGWADRVAAALATREGGLRYANLAVRGRLLDQVVAEQVPAALALRPDLVSFHAGPNDVLRPGRDVGAVVAPLRRGGGAGCDAAGVQVLLFTVIERAGGTGRTAARLAARFARFNAGVRRAAAAHRRAGRRRGRRAGAAGPPALARGPAAPGAGGARPGGRGRARDARRRPTRRCSAASPAGGGSRWRPAPRPGRRADLLADVRWVRRYLTPWVVRRLRGRSSGDGLAPKHLELVDAACRHRGTRAQRAAEAMRCWYIRSASTRVAASASRLAGSRPAAHRALHARRALPRVRRVEHQVVAGEQRADRALGGVVRAVDRPHALRVGDRDALEAEGVAEQPVHDALADRAGHARARSRRPPTCAVMTTGAPAVDRGLEGHQVGAPELAERLVLLGQRVVAVAADRAEARGSA